MAHRVGTVERIPARSRAARSRHSCGPCNVLRAARQGFDLDFYTAVLGYAREILDRARLFQPTVGIDPNLPRKGRHPNLRTVRGGFRRAIHRLG